MRQYGRDQVRRVQLGPGCSPMGRYTGPCVAALIAVTYSCWPDGGLKDGIITARLVFFCGWVTALSTGLGTLPFCVLSELNGQRWASYSNCVAAGMMLAASLELILEGIASESSENYSLIGYPGIERVLMGALLGFGFVHAAKHLLHSDSAEPLEQLMEMDKMKARQVSLIILVMTMHSATEGVGIGVSFGGKMGAKLGTFVSASLAVHNIPEGLAVALTLIPRGMSKMDAALCSIFTSLPQPLLSVPAYYFVEEFAIMLPIGLGFSAGAMVWIACVELIPEALEDGRMRRLTMLGVVGTAFVLMIASQEVLRVAL